MEKATENEARLRLDLWCASVLTTFKRAIHVQDALARAYQERTGLELQPESEYTVEDMRRAVRILRAEGLPEL